MNGFSDLNLIPTILKAVQAEGYETPTPIQSQAIPVVLAGKDLLACAQTGTGKTAAFALPILQLLTERNLPARVTVQAHTPATPPAHLEVPRPAGPSVIAAGASVAPAPGSPVRPVSPITPRPVGASVGSASPHAGASHGAGHPAFRSREIRVLVLTPTRELASQIEDSFVNYGKGLDLRSAVVFGGVGQNAQVNAIRRGLDILVATPGRLLDLMNQRLVRFNHLEIFVLDEADRMLDMGFIHDVRKVIAAIPKKRQTLFFSATMPPEISKLSQQILTSPVRIEVTPVATTAEKIQQGLYLVPENLKTSLLIHLLQDTSVARSIVFTRTKRDANRVAESLAAAGIGAAAIHGNKSQGARERALDGIKNGQTRVLVATDIAARGIDIDQVTHVFNYDVPDVAESYVHRIGRTARAGNAGMAASFCAPDEHANWVAIERLIRKRVPLIKAPEGLEPEARKRGGGGGGDRGRRGGGGGFGGSGGGRRGGGGGRGGSGGGRSGRSAY